MTDGNVDVQIKVLACASVGGCIGGFITASIPYLQFCVLVVTLIVGLRGLLLKRKS